MTLLYKIQNAETQWREPTHIINDKSALPPDRTNELPDENTEHFMQLMLNPQVSSLAPNFIHLSIQSTRGQDQDWFSNVNAGPVCMASHQGILAYENMSRIDPLPGGIMLQSNGKLPQAHQWLHLATEPSYNDNIIPSPLPSSATSSTPIKNTLPAPSSYAHLEPTFSRRLVRSIYQTAYHMLTNSSVFPPSEVLRIFGFCLQHNAASAVANKLRVSLGLGNGV